MRIRNLKLLDELYSRKLMLIFLIIFSTVDCAAQASAGIIGEWAGSLKDSSSEFEYKLKLEHEESGVYTGVSTSISANFYCESKVKAVKQNGRLIVSEIEVLKTNYPNRQELCLLQLVLTVSDSKLSGNFSPLSNTSNCLSGTISLNKIPSRRGTGQVAYSQKPIKKVTPSTPKLSKSSPAKKPSNAVEIVKKDSLITPTNARVENKLRVIELNEDEAELTILDNMAIDGDIVTLIDNGNVIFRKVTLSKIPLTYKINNARSSIHLIKFFAENLGATPPNTGVLIVKTRKSLTKTDFSSDLNQTATIQINLKKVL